MLKANPINHFTFYQFYDLWPERFCSSFKHAEQFLDGFFVSHILYFITQLKQNMDGMYLSLAGMFMISICTDTKATYH